MSELKTSEEIKDMLLHSMSQLVMEHGITTNAWIVSEDYLEILKRDAKWMVDTRYFDVTKNYKIFICGKPVIVAAMPNIAMAAIVVEEF